MDNKLLFDNSKKALDYAELQLKVGDYDSAITLLAAAYSQVRQLMEHTWRLKCEKVLQEQTPGENTQ